MMIGESRFKSFDGIEGRLRIQGKIAPVNVWVSLVSFVISKGKDTRLWVTEVRVESTPVLCSGINTKVFQDSQASRLGAKLGRVEE